jgi:hypothetical protein
MSDEELNSVENTSDDETDEEDEGDNLEEADLIQRIREHKPVRLSINLPSTMLTIGRSKMGKTTFAMQLIVGHHIRPQPMMYFAVLHGKDAATLKSKAQQYMRAIAAVHKGDSYRPELRVRTSVEELIDFLSEESRKEPMFKDIPKMIILDDQMHTSTVKYIQELTHVHSHHLNAFIYMAAHNLFTRNQNQVRDGSDYIVIFPGQEQTSMNRFLYNYPKGVRSVVREAFGAEVQGKQNDVKNVPVHYSMPIIIDRSVERVSQNCNIIWTGIDDTFPQVIKIDDSDDMESVPLSKTVDDSVHDEMKNLL